MKNPSGGLLLCDFSFSRLALVPSLISNGRRASAVLIHGGGAGQVTSSDGSTFETNVSFTALSSNNTIAGNWTL